MSKTHRDKKVLDFNGGWTSGEAARQIGKKMTEKVVPSEKVYSRKNKSWKKDLTQI
jgi:1,4-dihydroxy-2-naphthoyl-CoA synthase